MWRPSVNLFRNGCFLLLSLFIFIVMRSMDTLLAQGHMDAPVRQGWISGTYVLSRKKMVAGATIKISSKDHKRIYLTSTNEEGTWKLMTLPEGMYNVEIFKEGFFYIEKKDVEVRFPFKTVIELKARPSFEAIGNICRWGLRKDVEASPFRKESEKEETFLIQGKVATNEGQPILDAEIKLKDIDREVNPYKVYSEGEGSFHIEGLPAGRYALVITAPGYLPLRSIMDLGTDTEIHAKMLLQPLNYESSPSELLPMEEAIPPL